MEDILVSVIIVNYNTKYITNNCIQSIFKNTYDVTYEIIVVDNSSTDGSEEYFSQLNGIRYLYQHENLGFGRANNIGITEAKGKYCFLLNSDTIIKNNVLKKFVDYSADNKDNLLLGAWLLDMNDNITHSYGRFLTCSSEIAAALRVYTDRLPMNFDKYFWKETFANDNIYVDYITGADLFIPKKCFDEVGIFDDSFFMYCEESDLQRRMRNAGYMSKIIIGPEIVHYEQGSQVSGNVSKKKNGIKLLLSTKSILIYLRKYNNFFKVCLFKFFYLTLRFFPILFSEYKLKTKMKFIKIVVFG